MTRRGLGILMLILLFPAFCRCQSIDALTVCNNILNKAARDIYTSRTTYDHYDTVFSNYCEADGSVKQKYVNSSASIVYEVPMQGGENIGTSDTSVSQFCKLYKANSGDHRTFYMKSDTVANDAVTSAVNCLKYALTNDSIEHNFGTPDVVTISVSPRKGGSINVSGLSHDKDVSCVGPKRGLVPSLTYDDNTQFTIDPSWGTYTITCKRKSSPLPNGRKLFQAESLTLTSTAGPYNVSWPGVTVLPVNEAEKVAAELAALRSQVEALKSELATVGTSTVRTPFGFTKGTSNTFTCPDGQFVSQITAETANPGHSDSVVGNISFQCRKVLASDGDKP